jgi:hypothetical protein
MNPKWPISKNDAFAVATAYRHVRMARFEWISGWYATPHCAATAEHASTLVRRARVNSRVGG